jgi:hypothetical protein
MEKLPIWQIVAWIITGLLAIVTFFSQIAIKSVIEKLKQHDADLINNKMEIEQLKSLVEMNTKSDEYRMASLQKSFDSISEGIRDIKQSQHTQQQEVKTLDKRLTDFIIDTLRGK